MMWKYSRDIQFHILVGTLGHGAEMGNLEKAMAHIKGSRMARTVLADDRRKHREGNVSDLIHYVGWINL